MTQITPFTAVPNRGMSQETLVETTNTFFSEVGGFVGQANQLIGDINTAATNAIFTAPDWVAQAYESHKVVIYTDHNVYMSTEATLSTDVPGVSAKWQKLNANQGGSFDMQVFTSSGTWTKPEGASMVRIILCGGGGGGASGGKCGTTVSQVVCGGSGGAGAGVCDLTFHASVFNATATVTVGAGGAGGIGFGAGSVGNGYPGNPGTDGGNTSVNTSLTTITVYGGGGGSPSAPTTYPYTSPAQGGNSYITEPDINYPYTTNPMTTSYLRTYTGAQLAVGYGASDTTVTKYTVFGGACAGSVYTYGTTPYKQTKVGVNSMFGGASGRCGDGIITMSSVRQIDNIGVYSGGISTKFLPSYFGSYTSVGGVGGRFVGSNVTDPGVSGTNATGYGAGGGGGPASNENNTPGNGGNGSPGIAIIISW